MASRSSGVMVMALTRMPSTFSVISRCIFFSSSSGLWSESLISVSYPCPRRYRPMLVTTRLVTLELSVGTTTPITLLSLAFRRANALGS